MIITEDSLIPLMDMGFTIREAKIGLRACNMHISTAAQWIMNRRAEIEERKREEEEKYQARKRQKELGKTVDGEFVDLEAMSGLSSMGFSEELVVEALKQTNNDQMRALDLLTTNPELLMVEDVNEKMDVSDEYLPQPEDLEKLLLMGFSEDLVYGTLLHTKGDSETALTLLLEGQGVSEQPPGKGIDVVDEGPSMNVDERDSENTENAEVPTEPKIDVMRERELELLDEVNQKDELARLDFDLSLESEILAEYKSKIEALRN